MQKLEKFSKSTKKIEKISEMLVKILIHNPNETEVKRKIVRNFFEIPAALQYKSDIFFGVSLDFTFVSFSPIHMNRS